jgi:hypothetical protein
MKASALPAIELSKRFGVGASADQQEALAISHRLAVPAAAVQVLED